MLNTPDLSTLLRGDLLTPHELFHTTGGAQAASQTSVYEWAVVVRGADCEERDRRAGCALTEYATQRDAPVCPDAAADRLRIRAMLAAVREAAPDAKHVGVVYTDPPSGRTLVFFELLDPARGLLHLAAATHEDDAVLSVVWQPGTSGGQLAAAMRAALQAANSPAA